MDRDGNIRLDPEVIEGSGKSRMPLSDLYGLPVFASDTVQKAGEHHTEEKETLKQIRQEVFMTDGQGEKEKLERINGQIFQVTPVPTVEKTAEMSEAVPGMWVFLEIMAIGFMVLLLVAWKRKKNLPRVHSREKEGRRDDIDV